VTRYRDPKTISGPLATAERGLNQLERIQDPEERRARLGPILYDLIALEKALSRQGGPSASQVWLDLLMRRALEVRGKLGPRPAGAGKPARPSRRREHESDPVFVYWRSRKLSARAAAGLRAAGIGSLKDLGHVSFEQLLAIPGVGVGEIRRCEALLGRALSRKEDYWTSRGLPGRTAGFLVGVGIETLEDLKRMTRGQFFRHRGLGERALRQCEALLGRPLPWPEEDWRKAGCQSPRLIRKLVQAGIFTVADLNRQTDAELAAAGLTPNEVGYSRKLGRKGRR
jgi:rhodanese-related sulfurtransferase